MSTIVQLIGWEGFSQHNTTFLNMTADHPAKHAAAAGKSVHVPPHTEVELEALIASRKQLKQQARQWERAFLENHGHSPTVEERRLSRDYTALRMRMKHADTAIAICREQPDGPGRTERLAKAMVAAGLRPPMRTIVPPTCASLERAISHARSESSSEVTLDSFNARMEAREERYEASAAAFGHSGKLILGVRADAAAAPSQPGARPARRALVAPAAEMEAACGVAQSSAAGTTGLQPSEPPAQKMATQQARGVPEQPAATLASAPHEGNLDASSIHVAKPPTATRRGVALVLAIMASLIGLGTAVCVAMRNQSGG